MSGEVGGGRAWNPWKTLRGRTDLRFAIEPMPEGVYGAYVRRGDRKGIIIAKGLGRRRRNATLAHELVHDERDGGCPTDDLPEPLMVVARREERRVEREVARRLVPLDGLAALARSHQDNDLPPFTVYDVAEIFDVPEDVASEAMRMVTTDG